MKTKPVLLALLLSAVSLAAADAVTKNVGVEEFEKLRQDKASVVLDVRTEKEFKAGHIKGAMHLDWNSSDFAARAAKLDKSRAYLVHCAVGGRSAKACKKMEELGFTNLVNFAPGMKGWEKAGKPVEK
jgi:rhodanese-related sulfurtransferase